MNAWKDLERRVARALGGTRRGAYEPGSDVVGIPLSVECKRTTRYGLRSAWVSQARRQSREEGYPWVLVIAEHNDAAPIAVIAFSFFAELVTKAELSITPRDPLPVLLDRFWGHVDKTDGCWLWQGPFGAKGYGRFSIERHPFAAHRVVWLLTQGAVGDQMVLHRCGVPACVRPEHLYLGDDLANMQDRLRHGRNPNANKTHCKRGHEYTAENTYRRKNGSRLCRQCTREDQRQRRTGKQAGLIPTPLEIAPEPEEAA